MNIDTQGSSNDRCSFHRKVNICFIVEMGRVRSTVPKVWQSETLEKLILDEVPNLVLDLLNH